MRLFLLNVSSFHSSLSSFSDQRAILESTVNLVSSLHSKATAILDLAFAFLMEKKVNYGESLFKVCLPSMSRICNVNGELTHFKSAIRIYLIFSESLTQTIVFQSKNIRQKCNEGTKSLFSSKLIRLIVHH